MRGNNTVCISERRFLRSDDVEITTNEIVRELKPQSLPIIGASKRSKHFSESLLNIYIYVLRYTLRLYR